MVSDPQGLDPALLATGQCDEVPQFDELGFGEVAVKLGPQSVVGDRSVPQNGARVPKGRLLASIKSIGVFELQQFVVVGLGESLPSSLDGPLDPSILTFDRL